MADAGNTDADTAVTAERKDEDVHYEQVPPWQAQEVSFRCSWEHMHHGSFNTSKTSEVWNVYTMQIFWYISTMIVESAFSILRVITL